MVKFFVKKIQSKCDVGILKGVRVTVTHGELCHAIIPQEGMVLVKDVEEPHCSHKETDRNKDVLTCQLYFPNTVATVS